MKILQLLFILLLGNSSLVLAQGSKIADYYKKGDYEKCMKFCEKALDKDSKNLEAILYKAMVYTQWMEKSSEDKNYKTTKVNARSKALRELTSLRKKDRTRKFQYANEEEYNFVRSALIVEAEELVAQGEIGAAQELYLQIMNNLQDWTINFYVGCSWIKRNDLQLGMRYLNMGMKEYFKLFKQQGRRPEPAVFEHILEAVKELAMRGVYMQAFNTFGFIDLFYERSKNKEIDETYIFCLKTAMNDIAPSNPQCSRLLLEYEKAIDQYPQNKEIADWKIVFIQNTLDWIPTSSYTKDKPIAIVESTYRFMLDSMKNTSNTLQQINKLILAETYALYPQEGDKQAKSLKLYELFKTINLHTTKEEKIIEQFLDYGINKKDLNSFATALLIYKKQEKDLTKIADKMAALEAKVTTHLQSLGDDYAAFDELLFWLNEFPEFATTKKTAQTYFLKHTKALVSANDFSKAGLFLLRAQEYFPKEEIFKKLKRQCVEQDYKINYLGSEFDNKVLNWTGSVENCNSGEVSKTAKEKTVQRYDFARRLLGFPDGTVFNEEESKYCQAGALCMKAQGELSHNPDKTWKCYSKDAARGARNSLGIGYTGSYSIFGMIQDAGPNNKATGHRGNLLTPKYKGFVYGATDNTVALSATSDKQHSKEVLKRFDTDFVSWPPRGPVPAQFVFNRWSFKPYNHNFTFKNATIKMYLNAKELEVKVEHETTSKLGWVPVGLNTQLQKEQKVKVVIELDVQRGYNTEYQREKFEYEVIMFPI